MSIDCNTKSLSKWHSNCSHDIYNIVQESKLETFSSLLPKQKATLFSGEIFWQLKRGKVLWPHIPRSSRCRGWACISSRHTHNFTCAIWYVVIQKDSMWWSRKTETARTWPQVATVGPHSISLSRWAGWRSNSGKNIHLKSGQTAVIRHREWPNIRTSHLFTHPDWAEQVRQLSAPGNC